MNDDYAFTHEPDRQRFTAKRKDDEREVGEAHYRLLGDDGIDFDHTVVSPDVRGRGIASDLIRVALTSDLARDRTVVASCPFVADYLGKHPELG